MNETMTKPGPNPNEIVSMEAAPGKIHTLPPLVEDLLPGETRVVQLQRNQLGPDFPPRPCVYLYRRAGNRLFATLLDSAHRTRGRRSTT